MSTTTVYHDTAEERAEFERRRNCSRCGRRLVYSQYETTWPDKAQILRKRCPMSPEEDGHDFLELTHGFPARDIRGHLTPGSRAIVDARARSTRVHDL